jgi:hypothetical protein
MTAIYQGYGEVSNYIALKIIDEPAGITGEYVATTDMYSDDCSVRTG